MHIANFMWCDGSSVSFVANFLILETKKNVKQEYSVPNALFFLQKKDVNYLRKRCFLRENVVMVWSVFGEGANFSSVFLLFE